MFVKFRVILLAILLSSCTLIVKENTVHNRVNHFVLCWLKEPGNMKHREKIIEGSRSFRSIPGVLEARAGLSVPSGRKAVNDSFDVGIYLTFNRIEDMERYITHPIHKKAVKEVLLPLVDRIIIHDFME